MRHTPGLLPEFKQVVSRTGCPKKMAAAIIFARSASDGRSACSLSVCWYWPTIPTEQTVGTPTWTAYAESATAAGDHRIELRQMELVANPVQIVAQNQIILRFLHGYPFADCLELCRRTRYERLPDNAVNMA